MSNGHREVSSFSNFPPVITEERSVAVAAESLYSYKSQVEVSTYILDLVELLFLEHGVFKVDSHSSRVVVSRLLLLRHHVPQVVARVVV